MSKRLVKSKRKGAKLGPKKERIVITEDPKTALDKLLKTTRPPHCDRCGGDGVEQTDIPGTRQWWRCLRCRHLWSKPKRK
jgi:hypothetical protein